MCSNLQSTTTFRIGLAAFVLSSILQMSARHHPAFHPDLMDGLHGACLGIFFGTMAQTIWRNRGRTA